MNRRSQTIFNIEKGDLVPGHPCSMPPLRMIPLPGEGPEDVLFADDGSILTGLRDGRILRVTPESAEAEVIARTGGVPLGLDWLAGGDLLVCDAERGLLSIDPSGAITVLAETDDGMPLPFCNNAAVAGDGTIYFSSSSRRNGYAHSRRDVIENIPTGRLLCLRTDGSVETLVDGLAFANGVAVAPDLSAVLVAETGTGRIRRHWLRGSNAGTTETLAEDLPGLPDNLSLGSDGLVWVALVAPFGDDLRKVHALPTWARRLVARLPQPQPERLLRVLALTFDGAVVHDFSGDADLFHMVTGVREAAGTVAIASIEESAIATFGLQR